MENLGTDNLAVIILASVSILYQLRRVSAWLTSRDESSRGAPPDLTRMVSELRERRNRFTVATNLRSYDSYNAYDAYDQRAQ